MGSNTMGTKTQAIVAPGIHRLMNGSFRVRVATGDRQRGGQQRETTFPGGASIREMKAWQTTTKAELLALGAHRRKGAPSNPISLATWIESGTASRFRRS